MVFIASNSPWMPYPVFGGYSHYAASKGAVVALATQAAKELKRYGLSVSRNLISQWLRRGKLTHATPTETKRQYVFNLGELAALLDCHR